MINGHHKLIPLWLICVGVIALSGCSMYAKKPIEPSPLLGLKTHNVSPIPKGFVRLYEVDMSIYESNRHFTNDNITGKPVTGYLSPKIVLTGKAAEQLKAVNKELKSQGFNLVVYDAYRPKQSAKELSLWAKEHYLGENTELSEYSDHTRGSSVDVTLIAKDQELRPIKHEQNMLMDGNHIAYMNDGTFNMGTHYEDYCEASKHGSPQVTPQAAVMRNFLRALMKKHGFESTTYWWHYKLKNEPFPKEEFDFTHY